MILQALVRCYDALAERGQLDRPGWLEAKVSWSIELDEQGQLKQIIPLGTANKNGKTVCTKKLPEMVKRASGVAANFLCDNAMYMLGVDSKGKKARTVECFKACAQRHLTLLEGVDQPFARAICRFFETWDAQNAEAHPLIAPMLDDLKTGGNLVFSMRETFAQDVPEIRDAWDRAYGDQADAPHGRCLVTGEEGPIAVLHPSIKGVAGAQATGASLVSFNGHSYESYGRRKAQGLNAPVGERAAFAYGAALNYMLRERGYRSRLGSTTMVYWAEGAERAYSSAIAQLFGDADNTVDQEMLRSVIGELCSGRASALNGVPLQPDNRFYILGLAPNASRLSVRFFLENSFRGFLENLNRHQKRMEIVRPSFDERQELSVWAMLNETVNKKSTDKKPPDDLVGEVLRAILMDTPYPAALYAQVQLRLRAEQDVNRGKAAIIKAYLTKNVVREQALHPMKEVLEKVDLNKETNYAPYVWGRLFAVLEKLQEDAMNSENSKLSATISDRYFSAACVTPELVFIKLMNLSRHHLKKLPENAKRTYEDQIENLCGRFTKMLPRHLTMEEQGAFQLGYYHQRQDMYTKKEDRNNG